MKEKILNYIDQDGLLHILCCSVLVSVLNLGLPLWKFSFFKACRTNFCSASV